MQKILQPLIDTSHNKRFSAGTIIYYPGEVPLHAAILISGIVRVYGISKQGDEQVVTFHITGEFFPTSWIFKSSTSTLFFYEALTDCEVAYVNREELLQFIHSTPKRTAAMLDYFSKSYSAALIRINALEQSLARDKLLHTLYFLSMRYGKKDNETVKIPFSLTHQEFANLVGVTRETVAMEMSKLKKQKIVSYNKQLYIVALPKLLTLMGEDSFKNVSIEY